MKAWVKNGIIRDVCAGNPSELYHPDVALHYTEDVPDNACNGDAWDGVDLVKPEAPPLASPPSPPQVTPVQFKLLFTPAERVAIKSARSTDAMIDDFYEIVEDPRLTMVDFGLQSTVDGVGYLVSKGLITEARKAEIINGVLK